MFDGQLVRPPKEFIEAARDYVCVRIVDINRIDLNLYPFDYDLTMAFVLGNADGTVYHRYGGRDQISRMHMETLLEVMSKGLETHADYQRAPRPPEVKPRQSISELVNERLSGRMNPTFGCFHCHYVREARQYLTMEEGKWTPDQFWIWPGTERVGLVMDQHRQDRVEQVLAGSAADRSGIRPLDQLVRLSGQRILTKYDIQAVLDRSEGGAVRLGYSLLRDGRMEEGELDLAAGWKTGDPGDYLWRVRNVFTEHMLKFLPSPGFIGKKLGEDELAALGLPGGSFALRVGQLNHGTHLAGIRMGDVVLSAGGRSGFGTVEEFHQWCELLRRSGRGIKMGLLRFGSEMDVMVSLELLNYSRVARSPRVKLGFIVQELPGDEGLRVGHVTDDSSAERTGLQIGDRIVTLEGQAVGRMEALTGILNNKVPGDLLKMQVTRDGALLQFGFVLPGEEEMKSDLARLSEPVGRRGQELTCEFVLKLPEGWHIYSVNRPGFGVPTRLEFRGRGFELLGPAVEPEPRRVDEPGLEPMWVLEGTVEVKQAIRVTDPGQFQLLLRAYAQVCDDSSCHEFRAVLGSSGLDRGFSEFHGRFEDEPLVGVTGDEVLNP